MEFICLDPRKDKRAKIKVALGTIGRIEWLSLLPLSLKGYPQSSQRSAEALQRSARPPRNRYHSALKRLIYQWQYNYARKMFEQRKNAVAVCWNGLNGTRRVFMTAAKDAGCRTLFFELSPFNQRVTVDPAGVNFENSLPREATPYLAWCESFGRISLDEVVGEIRQRPTIKRSSVATITSLAGNFIFFPLQVPGDSQLRLFGGSYRNLDDVVESLQEMASQLPQGWHIRVKEHPSAKISFAEKILRLCGEKLVLDNQTDTFTQVAAARAVMTVNSSVGLEAMFFKKPVLVLGQCFWAIPGVATNCTSPSRLHDCLRNPWDIEYSEETRVAFLSYLLSEYYPDISDLNSDGTLSETQKQKILDRVGPKKSEHVGRWINFDYTSGQ